MVTNSQEEKNVSPSYERRKALRDADGINSTITVLNSYPIEKYYIVADRLLGAFQDSFDARNLDDAYILGIRLATFCLEFLPQHKDYSTYKYKSLSAKNAKQVEDVLQKVERVTERMDAEEKIKQQQQQQRRIEDEERRRKIELEEETKRILREEEEKREMKMKKRLEEKEKKKKRQAEVERSAMSKLASLMKRNSSNNKTNNEERKEKEKMAGNNNKIYANSRKVTKKVNGDKKKTTGKGEESLTRNNDNENKNNTTTRGNEIKELEAPIERENEIANQPNESRKVETKKSSIEPPFLPKGMNNETKSLKNLTIKIDEDYKNNDVKDKNIIPSIAVEVSLSESSNRSPPGVDNDDDAFSSYKPISSNKNNKEEQQTIRLLHRTIQKQERRLKETEEIKIPKLIKIAKQKLKSGDRKGAIYCMKKKKKLEMKVVESLKDGIFNMETQILLLESAMEDREIAKIMKDATDTIEEMTMHNHEDIVTDDLSDAITEISKVVEQDILLDEEELLKELQEETSKKSSSEFVDDDISIPGNENILALPTIPSTKLPEKKKLVKSKITIWT